MMEMCEKWGKGGLKRWEREKSSAEINGLWCPCRDRGKNNNRTIEGGKGRRDREGVGIGL